jgi:hypothetical protein
LANGILTATFRAKEHLHAKSSYQEQEGIRLFDLEREHYFYGRIDEEGDTVILDKANFLQGVAAVKNSTNLLVDFVADAFHSFKANWRKAVKYKFDKKSVYYRDLKVHKSYTYGDLDAEYTNYMNILYQDFVDNYLFVDRRFEKIKNFKDFVREFLRYTLRICDKYPITKTGFITSAHCSPFISGLMLEISSEQHGLEHIGRLERYLDDKNYNLWVRTAAKFGFMVDKNAPWRLVFNIGSGWPPEDVSKLAGAQLFMAQKGISYENVMQYRYFKAYKLEMSNLQNEMLSLYRSFYQQYGTYEEEKFHVDKNGRCQRVKVTHIRQDREPPPIWIPGIFTIAGHEDADFTGWTGLQNDGEVLDTAWIQKRLNSEYWLRVILKLRLTETKKYHTPHDFAPMADAMVRKLKHFGMEEALRYINNLTKGYEVTKFNMKGKNWHGVSDTEYKRRHKRALDMAENPTNENQRPLTGTKNFSGR